MRVLRIQKLIFLVVVFFKMPLNIHAQFSGTNLLFWLRSDTALTTAGPSVTIWGDVSGNNFDFTTSSSPQVNTNATGGFQSVFFDNNNLISNSLTTINNFNVFIVYKKIGPPIFYERLIDHSYSAGFWVGRNGSSVDNIGAGYKNSPPVGVSGILPDSLANICFISKKNSAHSIYNGNNLLSSQVLSDFSPTASNRIAIGCDIALGGNLKADVFEVIFFNDSIRTGTKDSVITYLYNKYGKKPDLGSDITISNNFCDTTLNPGKHFTDFLWSTGDTTNTIQVNKSGVYWVKTTDIFGRVFTDTVNVSFPGHFLNPSTYLCSGSSLSWDTQLPHSGYTFLWQDSSSDSLITINAPGNYYVKIMDSFSCSVISDTVKIVTDNFASSVSLGPDVFPCAGNYITLVSGVNPAYTYTWSTGSHNDSLLIGTTSGQFDIAVTNTNNCVGRDTIIVTVAGQAPVADFSFSIGCKNSAVSFTNTSSTASTLTPITSSYWNFNDTNSLGANTSTLTNPFHTFSDTGTYHVKLKVVTSAGCEQTIIKTVHIAPIPTTSFVIVGPSCQNSVTQFTNQSVGMPGYSLTTSSWNFGDFTTSSLTSPSHTYTNNTQYIVSLLVTNSAGCSASASKTVNVNAEVTASFTNSPACLNVPTVFQSTSIAPIGAVYSWTLSGSNPTTPIATKTYTNSGVHYVTLFVDGSNQCTSTITKLINVFLPPVASFSISSFCSKDTINILNTSNAQSGILSSYNWKLNNSSFSTVQSPTLSLTTATTYSVKLSVTNSFGCKDSTTKPVTVFPLPTVDFITNPAAFYFINSPVTFSPTISNANSYAWDITGVTTTTVQSPVETFSNTGSYTVSLNLQDQQGCKGAKTKVITVTPRYLDLAILNVTSLKDDDGFMTVIADLANYGTVPISTFDMHYQISDAGNVKETWNGTLNPNSYYQYTFNARSASVQNSTNNITCVEIEKVNTVVDEDITNNTTCNSLNPDETFVSNPLPNPVEGDITLPITLSRDLDYTIAIYNSIGQIQYEETTAKGLAGLNFVTLPTASYARGAYIIKVMIDGKTFIKKFIKISSK